MVCAMKIVDGVRTPEDYAEALRATARLVPDPFMQLCMVDAILAARGRAYPKGAAS